MGLSFNEAVDAEERILAIEGKGVAGKLNYAYADGYAVVALERKYNMSYDELKKEVRKTLKRDPK